jgi:hypothetical protein
MARIKKYASNQTTNLQPQLTTYNTFVNDINPNSTYFRITEFKDTFTGGKNGFLIEGSEHLLESTEIKIEILDVEGNPIYYEPGNGVPEYYEGISKVIAVYIYEDTPIGNAKITILGELKTYIDSDGIKQNVPDEWKNVYNVKWEKTFKANRLLSNEDNVRFYKRPTVTIDEIVKPIFSNVVTTITKKGIVNGTPLAPQLSASLLNYSSPTSYLLTTADDTFWTASVVGTYLTFDDISYNPLVTNVINSREIIVQPPYSLSQPEKGSAYDNLVGTLTDIGYTASFNYVEGVDNLKTALTGSFAKIALNNLNTFVGDCARVKIFRKSQSDVSDYQFVQEIKLESNELLVDLESTRKNQEYYGIFDGVNNKNYWVTSSNSINTTFNQTFLYDSVVLNGIATPNYFYTTKSLNLTKNAEYTLNFDVRLANNTSANNYLRAFISGSKTSIVGGNLSTIQVQQDIITLDSSNTLLQKNNIIKNITSEQVDNARLYFEFVGAGWYIANVSLAAAQETAFSPDEITFIQSVPRSLPIETFLYRFEFYDINNNYIPVLVEATKTFNGGNLQTIRKQLKLVPSAGGFQFDSGSNPVPPTVITIDEQKTLLTGSVHYTSQSYDFFGNDLSASGAYTGSGQQFPGLLHGIGTANVFMTVQDFTGSRSDINVQLVKLTGECEGFTDTINIYKILDGFGGVNHIIRPYRGTQIRNSSTASLEIQAVRIDGINDIILSKQAVKNFSDIQLHILKTGSADYSIPEKFVNLSYVTASNYIKSLTTGSIGSKQIDYNATFTRDSIDFRRTLYLMPSSSAASGWAYEVSSSVLASIILEDLQDGLDSGVVTYNVDSFAINPRVDTQFRPTFAFATASFSIRGTAGGNEFVTASFQVFPSMSLNKDYVPEYWFYYTTQSVDRTISVVAKDDNKYIISSSAIGTYVQSPLSQTKNLTFTFTYTEPWTSASVSFDKTFTIVPEGKPGDESIVFEISPATVNLKANSKGVVDSYKSSITNIKVKQGSRYLVFTGSVNTQPAHGTFYIAQESIISSSITGGLVYFDNAYTESLIVSASYGMNQLSASLTFPLVIHPYYTSSIYTQSVVQNFTKVLDGAPQIEVIISPASPNLNSDEVGYITNAGYIPANTTIKLREGADYLRFTTQSKLPGTWRFESISGSNIQTGSLSSSSFDTATVNFRRFDHPYTTASVFYNIVAYPYSLGTGHQYTSSVFNRTQVITKNIPPANARSLSFKASSYTINYNRDGVKTTPENGIDLTATAFNTTGSTVDVGAVGPNFYFYFIEADGSETFFDGPYPEDTPGSKTATVTVDGADAAGPGENKTWKVKVADGKNPAYYNLTAADIKAEAQLTIAGVKAGADAYKLVSTNDNTSITADLWTTSFTGSGEKITTFKGTQQLTNTGTYPAYNYPTDYDYQGNVIGKLGYSKTTIDYVSPYITLAGSLGVGGFVGGDPASITDIIGWDSPATHSAGQVVYKVDFENGRQAQYVTQSIAVQFTPPAPYVVNLSNENTSAVYRVSGQLSLANTNTYIRVYRGNTELTNVSTWGTSKTDAYGNVGYPNQCKVTIEDYSAAMVNVAGGTYLAGGKVVGDSVNGAPAYLGDITGWTNPTTNTVAQIVFKIDCEGRQTFFKTQSLSLSYEGSTGPGIVMRGEWNSATNYSGSVETKNYRRDAVIYGTSPTTYYAAVSGSGPATYNKQGTLVGAHAPTPGTDNAYWQYLGQEEFFVAAKIAIFEESFVKNTVNIGNNSGSAFANIVLAGGRNDPYMAIGQYANIGYGNQGIFLGIYDSGGGTYSDRISFVNSDGSRYMKWNGSSLEIKGDINITGGNAATQAGVSGSVATAKSEAISTANGNTTTAIATFSDSLGAMAAIDSIEAGASATTYIGAGAIVTSMVATNLITSTNYSASAEAGNFSDTGTFISLANGTITTPGFALKSDGKAYFKGTLNSSDATFGAWTLNAQAFYITANSRIKLDAVQEQITVRDTNGATRFTANTSTILPSPNAAPPSPNALNPSATYVINQTSTNGDNNINYTNTYLDLGSFVASANGGQHNIRYVWNPPAAYPASSGYGQAQAAGSANAYLGVSLVITPDATNDIVAYGDSTSAYTYGQMINDGYYGSYGGLGGYTAIENNAYLPDPKTFTVSATLNAGITYRVKLLVYYELDVHDTSGNPYYENSYGKVVFYETGDYNRVSIEAVSAGTVINGGGFQSAVGGNAYIRHMVSPDSTGIYTYVKGGLQTDKQYHQSIGTNIGYDVPGYPMIKGYGRWSMINASPTSAPGTPSTLSIGGCITSLSGAATGRYSVFYTLTNAAGTTSGYTPSIFINGTRINTSQVECTFDYGKYNGDNTYTSFSTQDNNVDTLNNMTELSIIVVM